MPFDLEVKNIHGAPRRVSLDRLPDECPRCHSKVVPRGVFAVFCGEPDADVDVERAFWCVNAECQRLFIAIYERDPHYTTSSAQLPMVLAGLRPVEPTAPRIADLVTELSPSFYTTYAQSLEAEGLGLEQLTGIGLRKALEFLIKDFAISKNPTRRDEVVSKPLAACIREFVSDPNVAATAKRAAWLGNDETHYVRKWADKDIEDLKVLIRLTVNCVENVLLTEKYIVEMPE